MSIKSANIEKFKSFSQFQSLQEFNNHMEMWLVDYKKKFTKSELIGLKRLVRYSAKVPGVCNAKIGTILKAIHEDKNGHGISRSTFKRFLQKAKSVGMLTIYETERKNGSQSCNLYVFNRYASNELPKKEHLDYHKETSNLLETNNNINNRSNELDATYTRDYVPSTFIKLVKCYFNKAKVIEEYWRMARVAAYRNNREKETELVLHYAILAFKQMVATYKIKKIHNPVAYFYTVLTRKFEELYFEDLYEMGFLANDEDDFWSMC